MHLGCHAVLFREKIKNQTEALLEELGKTGFEGVEIGSRFFGIENRDYLTDILKRNNLELSGMHVGTTLAGWANEPEEMNSKVLQVAEFVKPMKNKNVVMSSKNDLEGEDIREVAKNIDNTASECSKMGVTLNYHNHSWEFINDAKIFYALLNNSSELHFALDLGWIYVAGIDPLEIIKRCEGKATYLHLREIGKNGKEFVDVGEGIFVTRKLLDFFEEAVGNGWVVLEYEEGQKDVKRYTSAYEYLSSLR